jgi:hypothetical protein
MPLALGSLVEQAPSKGLLFWALALALEHLSLALV